jgi:enterobactin synthetase component D
VRSPRAALPSAPGHIVAELASAEALPLARVLDRIQRDSGDQFIHRMVKVLPEENGDLPYVLAGFELGRYTPDVFERHQVAFPDHIRNSVPKRQAEFAAGRLCAQSMLELYGHGKHAVAIGPHREPVWPQGFIGSITHNGVYAAAVACPATRFLGIGIDIETVVGAEARSALMDLVVSSDELDCMNAQGGAIAFDPLLTLVFSAKESFFKAAFEQVRTYFDFDALKLVRIDPQHRVLHFEGMQTLSATLSKGSAYQAYFDFLGESSLFTVVVIRNNRERPGAVKFDSFGSDAIAV